MKNDMLDDREPPPLPPHGGAPRGTRLVTTCAFCSEPTPAGELSAFGARCRRCYASHCAAPTRERPLPNGATVPADVSPMHQWAHRLAIRLAAGERLSKVQLEALQEFEKRRPIGAEQR